MTNMTLDELRELVSPREGRCVSIFLPTIEKSQEVRQNQIRFKNLLDRASDQLTEEGADTEMLTPAWTLLDDGSFWQNQRCGLAVYIGPGFFQTFKLEEEVDELVLVNDRFHLKPLLPMLTKSEEEFFVLALSQKDVRLIRATESQVEEVDVPNMPKSIEEISLDDNEDETTLFHNPTLSTTRTHGGGRQNTFSGHGQGVQEENERRIERFFRRIDAALTVYLRDSTAPMVLAGVEYLAPIFHRASDYKHITEEMITGNQDGARPEALRDEAWKLIRHIFESKPADERERYRMLAGQKDNRVVKDIAEIVKAAPFARVETLFVDKNAKKWGSFDEENLKVRITDEQRPNDQDLLDFAAVQTLLNGGTVYLLDPNEVPEDGAPIAAIFRY